MISLNFKDIKDPDLLINSAIAKCKTFKAAAIKDKEDIWGEDPGFIVELIFMDDQDAILFELSYDGC